MSYLRLLCLLPATALLSTACLSGGNGNDGTAHNEHLYATCERDADCQGSGLLCDERRGCVECLEDDECPGDEQCRLGVCEGAAEEGTESESAEEDSDDAGASVSSAEEDETDSEPGTDTSTEGTSSSSGDETDAPSGAASEDEPGGTESQTTDDEDEPSGGTGDAETDVADTTDSETDVGGDETDVGGDTPAPIATPPGGECVVRLPATFRDFPGTHPDFGELFCVAIEPGLVLEQLDAEGKPVVSSLGEVGCITSDESFSEWYRDGAHATTVEGQLVLFDDGNGGFVNRMDDNGTQLVVSDPDTEQYGGAGEEGCREMCTMLESFECEVSCEEPVAEAAQAYALALDDEGITEQELAELQAAVDAAEAQVEPCVAECIEDAAPAAEACGATCFPCSWGTDTWCWGAELITHDGNPLFFPVDHITDHPSDFAPAKVPEEYGYLGWPWEEEVFGVEVLHNFYFTTELHQEFTYSEDMNATVELLGDDDIWVFVNGILAVDLGGLHPPELGAVNLSSSTAAQFGLSEGETFTVSVFHAERMMEGSSFRLRLSGFPEHAAVCED